MTIKNIDADNIVQMYAIGDSASEIAARVGVAKSTIYKILLRSGVTPRGRKHIAFSSLIVPAYIGGESENSIASRLGISRTVVACAIAKANIQRRSQSESEQLKWASMSSQARANQIAAAHAAAKEIPSKKRKTMLEKSACRKQTTGSKIGHLEFEFANALQNRGLDVTQQLAVSVYNLDIAIGNTAIEIHVNSANPHSHPVYLRRIMYLLKTGMDVIYIKCIGKIDINRTADKIRELINFTQRQKSNVRHYWMIRGSGELVTCLCLDGDQLATVQTFDAFLN